MSYLTRTELEHLLEQFEPAELLAEYEDRLDAAGVEFLQRVQAEEIQAAKQLHAWSDTFRASLPAVPEKPWSETPNSRPQKSPKNRWGWLLIAASCLLFLVPVWRFLPLDSEPPTVVRTLVTPDELIEKQRDLANAWADYAEALIQHRAQITPESQEAMDHLAVFYLRLTLGFTADHGKALALSDRMSQAAPGIMADSEVSSATMALDQGENPPKALIRRAKARHEKAALPENPLRRQTEKLLSAYVNYADLLESDAATGKTKLERERGWRWSAFFLELANELKPKQAQVLLRLIRLKEVLGEETEADALTLQLNEIMGGN